MNFIELTSRSERECPNKVENQFGNTKIGMELVEPNNMVKSV